MWKLELWQKKKVQPSQLVSERFAANQEPLIVQQYGSEKFWSLTSALSVEFAGKEPNKEKWKKIGKCPRQNVIVYKNLYKTFGDLTNFKASNFQVFILVVNSFASGKFRGFCNGLDVAQAPKVVESCSKAQKTR